MKIAAKQTLTVLAIVAGFLTPTVNATCPPPVPSYYNWCKPKAVKDCEDRYKRNCDRVNLWRKKCGGHHSSSDERELKAALADLKKDAAELQALVVKTFFDVLTGKIKVNDPKYLAAAASYVSQVNEINADIAEINALIAKGNFNGAAAKLAKIEVKLTGIVAAGNILFPPGVSLNV